MKSSALQWAVTLALIFPPLVWAGEDDKAQENTVTSQATKGDAIPTPSAWLKELQDKGALKSGGQNVYPSTILFLEDLPKTGGPVFAKIDAEDFNALGFLRTLSAKDLEFLFAINKRPNGKSNAPTKTSDEWLALLLEVTSADTILFMRATGPWEIIQKKGDKPQVILAKTAPTSQDAEGVHQWLLGLLGYEGVVLDRHGSFFLVGTLQNVQKKDTQALLLKGTNDQFALASSKREGAGLLQLVSHDGAFGVFELLLGEKPENVPNGTKIAIEKKKGKKAKAEKAK